MRLSVLPVLPVDLNKPKCTGIGIPILGVAITVVFIVVYDESLKAYLAPTGLVSEPRGDLTCRGVEEPWKLYVLYEPECVGG